MKAFTQSQALGGLFYPSRILLGVLILTLVIYAPIFPTLFQQWIDDPNYSHGMLIPLISAFILWRKRDDLSRTPPRPTWLGLPVLVFGLMLYGVGYIAADLFTMRFSLLITLSGVVLFFWGWNLYRKILFPLGFLFFMIPIPYVIYNSLSFPLKLFSSQGAEWSIYQCGIPVFREGNVLHIPSGSLEVVDACSGLRSIVTLSALAVAFAYFAYRSISKRIAIVLLAIPIAIFANVIRITLTGLLAERWGTEKATGLLTHELSGILVFVIGFVLLVLCSVVIGRLGGGDANPPTPKPSRSDNPSGGGSGSNPLSSYLHLGGSLLAALLILFSGYYIYFVPHSTKVSIQRSLEEFPSEIGSWKGRKFYFSPETYKKLGVDDSVYYRYFDGARDRRVELYVGYYGNQRRGGIAHSPKHCYPGSGWGMIDTGQLALRVDGHRQPVNYFVAQKGDSRQVVIYWFQGRDRYLGDEFSQKFYMLLDTVLYGRTDEAFVRISSPVYGNKHETLDYLERFTELIPPILDTFIP